MSARRPDSIASVDLASSVSSSLDLDTETGTYTPLLPDSSEPIHHIDSDDRAEQITVEVDNSEGVDRTAGMVGKHTKHRRKVSIWENKDGASIAEKESMDRVSMGSAKHSMSMHQLARHGDYTRIQRVIQRQRKKSVDHRATADAEVRQCVNCLDDTGLTPLHFAARYNQYEVVKLLTDSGADTNARGEDDITPLHFVARCRRTHTEGIFVSRSPGAKVPDEAGDDIDILVKKTSLQPRPPPTAESIGSRRPLTTTEETTEQIVQHLIKHGADVNASDTWGQRPLHYAATRSNEVVAKCLVSSPNILIDAVDAELFTPLHAACMYGAHRVARMLLRSGAFIYAVDEQKRSSLHLAAQGGHIRIVNMLLAEPNGAKLIPHEDCDFSTPLHLAIAGGYVDVVRTLITRGGANPNSPRRHGETPLHLACTSGHLEIVRLLVNSGANITSRTDDLSTPAHKAAEYDHVEVLKYLISCVPENEMEEFIEAENDDSCSPLQVAALENNVESVQLLLQAGGSPAAVDQFDRTAIFLAAMNNSCKALDVILSEATEVDLVVRADRYNDTPLHVAAEEGHVECVMLLLNGGADIEAKNEDEETPMHLAAIKGHVRVIKEILKKSTAPITMTDDRMNTPLHVAAYEGNDLVVRALLDSGADVMARNSYLWTALDCAASQGHTRTVNMLIQDGAPVDALDKSNHTPLHLACENGHLEVVKALFRSGADIGLTDKNGNNCLDIAIENGQTVIALAIIDRPDFEKAMRNTRLTEENEFRTPMRRLIRYMPDVARTVFDRCLQQEGHTDSPDYKIHCNFEFLEDLYTLGVKKEEDYKVWDEKGRLHLKARVCPSKQEYGHVLAHMVKESRESLLAHPLVLTLLRYKWDRFGQPVYYLTLGFYTAFILSLTIFVVSSEPPNYISYGTDNSTGTVQKIHERKISHKGCSINFMTTSFQSKNYLAGFVFIFTTMNLFREVAQLFTKGAHYFRTQNVLELFTYISALILVAPAMANTECEVWDIGWSVGAVGVCFSWINLTLFLRRFPLFGIYVVMFVDVLQTFARFFIVFLLFLIAFALGFFMLLRDHNSFADFPSSLLRTVVMVIGEFDFDDLFHNSEKPLLYPEITQFIFTLFVMLMTIIVMNLMVGLAVDDIKGVQEKARLEKLGMQVDLVMEVEGALPPMIRRNFASCRSSLQPNGRDRDSFFSRALAKILGGDATLLSTKNIVSGIQAVETPIVQLARTQDTVLAKVKDVTSRVRALEHGQARLHSMMAALLEKMEVNWEDSNAIGHAADK